MRWSHHLPPCMRLLGIAAVTTAALTLGFATEGNAVVTPRFSADANFPKPNHVAKQLWFWEGVFSRYGGNIILVHDADYPDLILDIIDFRSLAKKRDSGYRFDRRGRDRISQKYLDRYALAVERFRKEGEDAIKHGAMEERVFTVYSRNRRALIDLYKGRVKLRAQAGLGDEFARAAQRAQGLLPTMERIFKAQGVPQDLTKLAFVESMFNLNARSKVGATGIWQFMPYTAKNYMLINHYIDERNSPYKATKAAAQLLSENYADLKSWPLAVTAYNHGRGGMAKAARTVGSNDLGKIIETYEAPSFGFASKNFYAEFLAARNVYNSMFAQNADRSSRSGVTSISIRKPISVAQLLRFTPLDANTLKQYNPCLLPRAFGSHKYQPLPPQYELIVPNHIADKVRVALDRIQTAKTKGRS